MATQKVKWVQTNTAPPLVLTCERTDGTVIDVTGATVDLILQGPDGTITNTGNQTCTLTTPTSGIVTYTPTSGDFDSAGQYVADLKITYSDSSTEILYDQLKFNARANIS